MIFQFLNFLFFQFKQPFFYFSQLNKKILSLHFPEDVLNSAKIKKRPLLKTTVFHHNSLFFNN